jgi:sialate O-acetylesterase
LKVKQILTFEASSIWECPLNLYLYYSIFKRFKNSAMRKIFSFLFLLSFSIFAVSNLSAEVKLARIFGNNMVLQQNMPIPLWGWASPGEKVTVSFGKEVVSVKSDKTGKWMVKLKAVPAGGPFEMTIQGENKIIIKNILVGEVWVCSGQSNMEFSVSSAKESQTEITNAKYPQIRLFTVSKKLSLTPVNDLDEGEWVECSPETVGSFSAVGYFFGRNLHKTLNTPVGLIHTSWGGTNIESWTSNETIKTIPDFDEQMKLATGSNIKNMEKEMESKMKAWNDQIQNNDLGRKEKWENPGLNASDWKSMELPTLWESAGLPGLDGVVWFRKEISVSPEDLKTEIKLSLGPIDDSDDTYINGQLIGSNWERYNMPRIYTIHPELLSVGKNVIMVRVIDSGGGGGIYGDKNQMFIQFGDKKVSLVGEWKYKVGLKTEASPKEATGPNAFPTLLYNAMINPIVPYAIKGAIWYQGENNAGRAYQYRTLFPAMITDWRTKWGEGDFTFLFVSLANFMKAKEQPAGSEWAELREAQEMTLKLPKTGQALAIDIGQAEDIHPKNKQDVGYRLSLNALKIAYNQNIVNSGPSYKSMNVEGNKIRLSFENTGSGLLAKDKYGYLKGFAIAGADQKFYWANASVENNSIVVWSDKVSAPASVRYAWADNPDDANLYNIEGLPAVPFRTDQWSGLTEGRK